MSPEDRKRRIIRTLRKSTSASIAELARDLGVNRETLRRDIARLCDEGLVGRKDGAVYLNDAVTMRPVLSEYGVLTREERLEEIARLLRTKGSLRITHLSRLFNVTTATIRSDLKVLAHRGVVSLRHGFAELADDADAELERAAKPGEEAMRSVVARALSHIESGDVVFLDDSSYSHAVAAGIERVRDITVVTDSLNVATALSKRSYPCEIVTLAGVLEKLGTAADRSVTEPLFSALSIDKMIFGVAAIHDDGSVVLQDPIPASTVSVAFSTARQVFLCATSETLDSRDAHPCTVTRDEIEGHVTEIIIDDAVDADVARTVFPETVPVALCAIDHTFHLSRTRGMSIGLAVYPGHSDFRQIVAEGIEDACRERRTFTLHRHHNDGRYESIVESIDQLIAKHVDLLIDYSTNYEVGVLIAQKAQELRIPLIMVDIPVQNSYYFGANNVVAGRIAGDAAAIFIRDNWDGSVDHVIALEKDITGSVCRQRIIGTIHALRQQVRVHVRSIRYVNCTRGFSYYRQKLERQLDRIAQGETCLVISYGEDTTAETHELIEEAAVSRRIAMVAHNYSHHVASLMCRPGSPLIGCVAYDQAQYGKQIMDLAASILDGRKTDLVTYTDHKWIPNERTYRS